MWNKKVFVWCLGTQKTFYSDPDKKTRTCAKRFFYLFLFAIFNYISCPGGEYQLYPGKKEQQTFSISSLSCISKDNNNQRKWVHACINAVNSKMDFFLFFVFCSKYKCFISRIVLNKACIFAQTELKIQEGIVPEMHHDAFFSWVYRSKLLSDIYTCFTYNLQSRMDKTLKCYEKKNSLCKLMAMMYKLNH